MPGFTTATCPKCGGPPKGIALVDGIGPDGNHKGWSEYVCDCDAPPIVWPDGERLRRRRINLRISQRDFAERLGIRPSELSAMEFGRVAPDDATREEWTHQLDLCASAKP